MYGRDSLRKALEVYLLKESGELPAVESAWSLFYRQVLYRKTTLSNGSADWHTFVYQDSKYLVVRNVKDV